MGRISSNIKLPEQYVKAPAIEMNYETNRKKLPCNLNAIIHYGSVLSLQVRAIPNNTEQTATLNFSNWAPGPDS